MGTYIIHFDDKPWEDLDNELYYRCKEIPWFSTTDTTISRLTPYTEDSAYAHGYTEAESKYREIRDELEKQAYQRGYEKAYDTAYADAEEIYESGKRAMYQKGLKDAWEAARKIGSNSMCSLKEMGFDFSQCAVDDYNPSWFVVKNYSASEAIEKIRQYEQRQEEQIQIGDEVINRDKKAVVTEITDRFVRIMYSDGSGYALFSENMTKTGRNFPEIAEVLQKMKESDNG